MPAGLPELVRLAAERAERAGFAMSCDPGAGGLLAVLAAAVPANGRVLELGTGTGVGTAWIVHGLRGRDDVEVVTVEIDAALRPDLRRCPGREVGRARRDGCRPAARRIFSTETILRVTGA